jgi:hypothetical protein
LGAAVARDLEEGMNKRIKKLWVEALRSGQYKQARGRLRTEENGFCCLGVLCNLHAMEHPKIARKQLLTCEYMGEDATPPVAVLKWAGLPLDAPDVAISGRHALLTEANDFGLSFHEIANIIEKQL